MLEVPLEPPRATRWFADLGLRWHAVPAISNMCLEIGGVCYPAAPFNGWYMGTEIGARNLADADRYDLLPVVADRLGLDTATSGRCGATARWSSSTAPCCTPSTAAGVTIADHHTESRRFLTHLAREERAGRIAARRLVAGSCRRSRAPPPRSSTATTRPPTSGRTMSTIRTRRTP